MPANHSPSREELESNGMVDEPGQHSSPLGLVDAQSGSNRNREPTSKHEGKIGSALTSPRGLGKAGRPQCHFL
jgi:hypothetical protein